MKSRFLVLAALILALPAPIHVDRLQAQAPVKPNIIEIIADDLDVNTLNEALTAGLLPNFKQLIVDQGVVFDNSFVPLSECCPDRATLLTGRYAHNTGVRGNAPPSGGVGLLNDQLTVPCWLQPAGYRSSFIGKYLNGYGSTSSAPPNNPSNPMYVPPCYGTQGFGWQGFLDFSTYTAYDYIVNDNGVFTDHRQFGTLDVNYQTDMITLRSLYSMIDAFIRSVPFFMTLSPASPHFQANNRDEFKILNVCPGPPNNAPLNSGGNVYGITLLAPPRYQGTVSLNLPHGPAFNEQDVSDKPSWIRNRPALTQADIDCLNLKYRRGIEALRAFDDMVKILFLMMDNMGVTQKTVVIFTSDNGYLRGEHRLIEKLALYEESIRVPLIIRGPWTPHHVSQMVNTTDIASTIAELAGATPNAPADGRSLVPLLQGQNPQWRNAMEIEAFDSAIDGGTPGLPLGAYPTISSRVLGVRVMNPPRAYWRLIDTNENELYDLSIDPGQLNNLASDPSRASEILKLDAFSLVLQTCQAFGCRDLEDAFVLR